MQKGVCPMKPTCISVEEAKEVCEDLLVIMQACRLDEFAAFRLARLREAGSGFRSASPWVQVETDRIASKAARLVCGCADEWRDAAAAALNRPSRVDVCIEAVRDFARTVRAEVEAEQPRRNALPVSVNIANRKRGSR
jgi:hypothetical protein